jgi:hypothetical protein
MSQEFLDVVAREMNASGSWESYPRSESVELSVGLSIGLGMELCIELSPTCQVQETDSLSVYRCCSTLPSLV